MPEYMYTIEPDFRVVVRAEDGDEARKKGQAALQRWIDDEREHEVVIVGTPEPAVKRFTVLLELEVDAEEADDALDVAQALCTDVTCGAASSMYWDAQGVQRLTFHDRGDGPIAGWEYVDGDE